MNRKKARSSFQKQCFSDKVFDILNTIIMLILTAAFLWPLIFVISASVSNPSAVMLGRVWLLPKGFTLEGYKAIFHYKNIWVGYRNTIIYTLLGTSVNLFMTICAAYPLSCKDFAPRKILSRVFMFTMFFSGGLIPSYLVVVNIGIYDTIWAMILPSAVHVMYIIIMRTYFQTSIPQSLHEAAELDGANTAQVLSRIVLPLSGPILAVMALYYGVGKWNSYFDALVYMGTPSKYPLQLFLREILINNQIDLNMAGLDIAAAEAKLQLAQVIKYGVIVVASLPVLCAYPFVQKFFVKGVMLGAIKE